MKRSCKPAGRERAALEKENHEHRLKQKEAEQQMELVRRRWELVRLPVSSSSLPPKGYRTADYTC